MTFLIRLKKGQPYCAVEVKTSEQSLDKNLKYLLERVKIPYGFQIHLNGSKNYEPETINDCQIRVMPAFRFLGNLV